MLGIFPARGHLCQQKMPRTLGSDSVRHALDKWLTDTDKFIPDNDMNLSLKKNDERSDIIAYLKQLSNQ